MDELHCSRDGQFYLWSFKTFKYLLLTLLHKMKNSDSLLLCHVLKLNLPCHLQLLKAYNCKFNLYLYMAYYKPKLPRNCYNWP